MIFFQPLLYTYCKSSDLVLGDNEDIIGFLEKDIEKVYQ